MSEEQERQETIKCAIWAFVIVVSGLSFFTYGIAWLSTAEKISADIYGAKHLEGRIMALENRPALIEHVHPETNKGFTGGAIK